MSRSSGNRIVLLRPDDLQSGPANEWVLQLANNLKLVSVRYNASVADVKVLTPKDKDARQLLKTCDVILLLLHQSWFSQGTYIKFIENEITEGSDENRRAILISTSPGIRDALNGKLKKFPSFSFFESHALEKDSTLISETMTTYWSILLDLVLDLDQARRSDASIIYLAQTETDISPSRDVIRRELMEYGYRVVPDVDLLSHQKDLESFINENVAQSRLAIHLIGNHYGDLVKDENCSISELQVRYIGEYLEAIEKDETLSTTISRLIWVDPEFNPSDNRQSDLVADLKRNIEKLHRTEIIQNPLELLKTLVIKRLREEDHVAVGNGSPGQTDKKQVYMIHHNSDERDAEEFAKRLSTEDINVAMLDYSGGHTNLLKEHKRNLRICDASIVYYGSPNRSWLQSKIMDLLKAPGFGRTKPLELRQLLAIGKDTLEDFRIPVEISLERATDPGKAISALLKNLKQ